VEMTGWEKKILDSPVRNFFQKHYEFRVWRQMLERKRVDPGEAILDAGCGSGHGTELLIRAFCPRHLVALDVRPDQVEKARRRLSRWTGQAFTADITDTGLGTGTFTAAFAFGLFHHIIPSWTAALAELGRVLRPGGMLLIGGEPPRDVPSIGFEREKLLQELARAGFRRIDSCKMYWGLFESHLCTRF
jgi:SAM-dependent methyltransferase